MKCATAPAVCRPPSSRRLSREDKPEWEGEIIADTAYLTARVSPNGRYLAFMSDASPTGYDNVDQNSGAAR